MGGKAHSPARASGHAVARLKDASGQIIAACWRRSQKPHYIFNTSKKTTPRIIPQTTSEPLG